MVKVSKQERFDLENVGVLKNKKVGYDAQDANYVVVNRRHKGRAKNYYVTETFDILSYLQRYDTLNLQQITPAQLDKLKEAGLVSEAKIQHPKEYKPGATVFIANDGSIRIRKVTKYMIALGYWKAN